MVEMVRGFGRAAASLLALVVLVWSGAVAANGTFDVQDMQVLNDRDVPEVCFTFSDNLPLVRDATLEDYVAISPPVAASVTPRGRSLCISGFAFGKRYQVTLRAGLPAAAPEIALQGERFYDIYMPDRPASIGFRGGNGYILPSALAEGLPLRTVNVDKAELRLIRVNDRNLVQQFARGYVGASLYNYEVTDLEQIDGTLVWEGEVAVPGAERNKPADTIVPVREVMPTIEPGLYLAAARNPTSEEYWEPMATQWFVISDLGITTFWADNGLYVYVRSLETAAPLAGVEVSLLAQNNAELAKLTTDAEGFALIAGGLLRGKGGDSPRGLLAYGAGDDFNVLDLGGPTLDLSDHAVGGRTLPGAVDAFLYPERGIYRPGETVFLTTLLRDRDAKAVGGAPLTFKLWRSDGAEYRSYTIAETAEGGYSLEIDLPGTARTGLWEVTAHLDPKGPPIGRTAFEVEDFVPPQIEFTLETTTEMASLEEVVPVELDGNYLYGAPASDLPGEYTLLVQRAENPFADLPGYVFGLVQENFTALRSEPVSFVTDEDGKALIEAYPDEIPDTTHPLEASVRVALFDLGGRPVYRRITLPVALQPYHIGIKAQFTGGAVAERTEAAFEVIAVDRAGNELAADNLSYAVLREEYDYVWYRSGGRWYSEWIVRESVVETGDLSLSAAEPALVQFTPDWGLYRLEVFDDATGVASSYRFAGGWWTDPTADRPDEVEVALDKESYQPGETAKVFIKPPFDGKVLVTVADAEVRWTQTLDVGKDGGFVEIPVADDWTAGVYVLATAYPTAPATREMLPRRAVGVDWLALDKASRALTVAMELPDMIRPSQQLLVPVSVTGAAPGEKVNLTLAAVDDAVLQLTGYETPDPLDYYLGKRALAVMLRDVYGYLIRAGGDAVAELRSGGDREGLNLQSLPERSSKVVSLYSGILEVGADGKVQVPLEIPDFNGRLRLMSVAWSKTRMASAEKQLVVRAPVIAEMTLPRFLAPGDVAQVTVALRNLDGAPGDYRVTLSTNGIVSFDNTSVEAKDLAVAREQRATRQMTAEALGVATVTLSVSGPGGFSLIREKRISVRPASPYMTERLVSSLAPGKGVTVTPDVAAKYHADTVTVALTLSSVPDYDVPGLLEALDRYPYGCAEQTVSRALPLIYANQVAQAIGLGDDAALSQRVQQAIYRLMNQQLGYGAFGLWGPWSNGEVWLSAYVTDFLTRAREAGYHVPQVGYARALEWLKGQTNRWLDTPGDFVGYAYSQYVLARAGQGDLSDLRYFYETRWQELPTPIARAQFSAALAWLGDLERARAGFADLIPAGYAPRWRYLDYGSNLRDLAAAVTLMAESGAVDQRLLIEAAERAGRLFAEQRYFSTQEMSWLVLATSGLIKNAGPVKVSVDGKSLPQQSKPFYRLLDFGKGDTKLAVKNESKGPLYQVLTVTGVPAEPLPAAENGFSLRRRVFDLSGVPVPLSKMQQGQSYLVLLEGRSHDAEPHETLIVDLLPAGWEIENANLGQGVPLDAFPWLGELSYTSMSEARDDRYAAAVQLTNRRSNFRVAYMVRAVTPGDFTLPGSYVEDMYRPDLMARGAAAAVSIAGR